MSGEIKLVVTRKRNDNPRSIQKVSTHKVPQYVWGGLTILMACALLAGSVVVAALPIQRVTIETFFPYYSPTLVQVMPGTAITWENPTSNLHSIIHDGCRGNERCAFDSGPIGPHQTFTVQNLPPGYYPYHCSYHPIMRGVLVVEESSLPDEI